VLLLEVLLLEVLPVPLPPVALSLAPLDDDEDGDAGPDEALGDEGTFVCCEPLLV
jgi:hypothetical protein